MHDVESGRSLPGFVRLEVADEMPAQREICCLRHLQQTFLDPVFAEVDLACGGGGPYDVRGEGLGDGDQADGAWIASDPAGRAGDAFADIRQPGADACGAGHYFGSFSSSVTAPFAIAAFLPSGAILRYVWSSERAPGMSPCPMRTMPSW